MENKELKVIDRRMEMSNVEREAVDSHTPNAVILKAMDKNYSPELIEKMMDLQVKWEQNEARKAYHKAMAAFKANPPKVWRDLQVKYEVGNKTTNWSHADLGVAGEAIGKGLGEHQLNHTWRTEPQENKETRVTCIITHELGHSESTWLQAGPDTTGSKNAIQAIGSTIFYLERYTLFALTGLAPARMDDDGKRSGSEPEGSNDFISPEQLTELTGLAKESGIMQGAFLKSLKVETLSELPVKKYNYAIGILKNYKGN